MKINDPKVLREMADAYEKKFEKLLREGKIKEADKVYSRAIKLRMRACDIAEGRLRG